MTLLDLAPDCVAKIIKMSVARSYEERLYSVGICLHSMVTKAHDDTGHQPILVRTHQRNVFAISRSLASQIYVDIV